MQRTPNSRRTSTLGRITLTHEEVVVLSMLASREVTTYRGSPYSGVRLYVQTCGDVRRKLKRVLERYEDAPLTTTGDDGPGG
jgi:hypothetical protein